MSEELAGVLRKITEHLREIEDKFDEKTSKIESHPSQNGGWKRLEESLKRIEAQVTSIDISLNDPNTGAIAKLNDQISWRGRVEPILSESRKQDERILRLELQLALYNKVTWALSLSTIGLIAKSLMSIFSI